MVLVLVDDVRSVSIVPLRVLHRLNLLEMPRFLGIVFHAFADCVVHVHESFLRGPALQVRIRLHGRLAGVLFKI